MSAAASSTSRRQTTGRSDRAIPFTLLHDSVVVVVASLAVRATFIWFKGPVSYSADLSAWRDAGELLAAGRNPYLITPFFSWPPVWVQIVFLLQRIGSYLGVSLIWLVPIFLIATESVLIVVLLWLLRDLSFRRRRALVLFGIALNPVCFILVCQHGNFDVLVGLLVLLSVGWLVRFERFHVSDDWLFACLWLGLGIALKSVPVLLLPLLLSGSRQLSPRVRCLGAVLALGPTIYGLGILHVLHAANVRTQIIGYRSVSGWFGVTGWFHLLGLDSWIGPYAGAFTSVIVALSIVLAAAAYLGRLATPERLVASSSLMLVLVPALGPGYGPQYFYWFWPVLLVSYALGSAGFAGGSWDSDSWPQPRTLSSTPWRRISGRFLRCGFPRQGTFCSGPAPSGCSRLLERRCGWHTSACWLASRGRSDRRPCRGGPTFLDRLSGRNEWSPWLMATCAARRLGWRRRPRACSGLAVRLRLFARAAR